MTSFYHGFDTRHWNPLVGCDHGAKFGCLPHCWAAQMVAHWGEQWGVGGGFQPRLVNHWLAKPLSWRKPQVVATGFLGDIACLTPEQCRAIVSVMWQTPQHTYLLLTKDPDRLERVRMAAGLRPDHGGLGLPKNVMLGGTVRNQEDADRVIPALLRIPAARYGLSVEPLLGPVDIRPWFGKWNVCPCGCMSEGRMANCPECGNEKGPRRKLGFVVAGCESGRGARWGDLRDASWDASTGVWTGKGRWTVLDWLRSIRDQCAAAGVPFMCKQLPVFKDGKWIVSSNPADFPPDLQCQERPR